MKLVLNIFLKLIFSFYLIFIPLFSISQQKFYEDIFYGGICFAGLSTGLGWGSGNIETYVEPGSEIKKVFLIYQKHHLKQYQLNENECNTIVIIDGTNYLLNNENNIAGEFKEMRLNESYIGSTHYIDITSTYQNITNHSITIPQQINNNLQCWNGNIGIIIIYENLSLNPISVSIVINDQHINVFENQYYSELNPIDPNFPIGFSIYSDIIASPSSNDGSRVLIEDIDIGLIGGSDSNFNSGFGTNGHFYYQNNQLFGLDDDTPDNLMNNSDVLADISEYISSTTSLNWKMQWQHDFVNQNVYGGFFISYSTLCDTFSVSHSPDTSICRGESLQLFATGGTSTGSATAYEWKAANPSALTHLSCTTCPNPIFSGDSSSLYSVQIWNNDSCSVVRPIKINVRDKPQFSSVGTVSTTCGLEIGSITAVAKNTSTLPISYALNGGNFQGTSTYTGSFTNLDFGNYVLRLKDGNGCISDTNIVVGLQNPTQALFTANPSLGAAPLTVSITNNSLFATDYTWFLNDVNQGSSFSTFVADTSGLYEIELIAWQHDPIVQIPLLY
jgi:hypothetical protein